MQYGSIGFPLKMKVPTKMMILKNHRNVIHDGKKQLEET